MGTRRFAAASALALACAAVSAAAQEVADSKLPVVEVISTVPVPGLGLSKEMVPGNVQTSSQEQITRIKPINLNSFLEETAGSVTVNNFQGNPFQADVNYRGFTASPLLGTPQGLSVYLDSVRVNEPFGDVVNWDMIPMNAIYRSDIIPGSNPLYGLNTLGGALALHTKDGFNTPQAYVEASGGSWGRWNTWAEVGGNRGPVGLYIMGNHFEESGWRDFSPTTVDQAFGKLSLRTDRTDADLTLLYTKSDLTGNGLIPYSMYQRNQEAIFTAPDNTRNELKHIALSAAHWLNDNSQIGGNIYYRNSTRKTLNGDFFDDFNETDFDGANPVGFNPGPGTPFYSDPFTQSYAPTGVFNRTYTAQEGEGLSLQYTWQIERNRFTVGTTYDRSAVNYSQTGQLGILDDSRNVQIPPPDLFQLFWPNEILSNAISGTYRTTSAFLTDTWSILPTVHLTASGRYNVTKVSTTLKHNVNAEELHEYPGTDDFTTSSESFTYRKFNPAVGLTWNTAPNFTLYGSYSQGSRVPSPIELGCANPNVPCTVPTALTDDPFLPQVVARTGEVGARGRVGWFQWDASVFRTDTSDDILFVSSPVRPQLGYFASFGKTRRQGIELGAGGAGKRLSWHVAYTYLDATFQSSATLNNTSNSSSIKSGTDSNGLYTVQAGDKIPGLPEHVVKLNGDYRLWRGWSVGGSILAQSSQYVRGNENNQHTAGGTDFNGRQYVDSGKSPGFAVVNLRTSYAFDNGLSIFAEIANLFDRKYTTGGGLGISPFSPGTVGFVGANGWNYNSDEWTNVTGYAPGPPRGIWVGVSYTLPTGGRTSTASSE